MKQQGGITTDSEARRTGATPVNTPRTSGWPQVLVTALAAAGFGADAVLERDVASGVFYVAVVALTAWWPGMRSTLAVAIGASALTLLGYFVSPPGGELWKAVANRLLALFAIWITAALVAHHKRLDARRDQTEARVARAEQQLRQTVEASPTGMLLVDRNGRITLANTEVARLFGYARSELLGQPIEALVPALDRTAHALLRARFVAEAAPRRMGGGREVAGVDRQGHSLPLEVGLARVETLDGEFVLATVTDLRERKQLERIHDAQALRRGVLDAEEAQRKRMAREVHDALGQALTALKLDIGWLARHLPDEPASLHLRAIEMEELTARTIDDVRRLSAELRPAVLDDHGLWAAVRWQVSDFEKRSGLRCTLALPEIEVAWDQGRSTTAFRMLQESLTNVARHAQARSVALAVRLEPQGDAVLEVRDDGCGFSQEQATRPGALGLLGMRERAELHGGSLAVTGAPGKGTTVTLRMPWGPELPMNDTVPAVNRKATGPQIAKEGS